LEPVKVGVVGVGNFGLNHARIYSDLPQTELVGVVDINENRGRRCSELYGTRYHTDYRELFGKVQAVSIVVPTTLHYQLAMEFLRQGVHVLVEKPITVDLGQAKRLVEFAKRRNLVLSVGYLERFNPAVMRLREMLDRPVHLEAHRVSRPTDRNLDVGVVWDYMSHDLDILIHLVDSPVVKINAIGASVYSDYEDVAYVQLIFQNGAIASLTASRISAEKLRQLKVTERSGRTYTLDFVEQSLALARPSTNGHPLGSELVDVKKDEPLRLELEHFAECVARNLTPRVSGEDGKRGLELAMQVLARMQMVKLSHPLGKQLIALAG
jgi:predicted dehydrogenase